MVQRTVTAPRSVDSAPYFSALVPSSFSAIDSATARLGLSRRSPPPRLTRPRAVRSEAPTERHQSIAALTLKDIDPGACAAFEERLLTLSAVHSLLTDESWQGAASFGRRHLDAVAEHAEVFRPVGRVRQVDRARQVQQFDGTAIAYNVAHLAIGREPHRGRDGLQHRLELDAARAQRLLGLLPLALGLAPVGDVAHEHIPARERQGLAPHGFATGHGVAQQAAG
ncbi:MAG: hypothetical protein J0J01_02590 [Reyranella sp.]|uniref:HWE histidine kinase domain-containing protein n=1 Tax=Reyranella sp. TaxID=1929291 RepID=UPI001AC5105C|nr:HWE histidine kinase domain-containing protein [Reyranella sp.]MBN9085772.1 hypothetical protein [Reyranella sp.]